MLQRLGKILTACSLVVLISGHWALLQSVAWVGMAYSYAQEDSLDVALRKTFDGQHPCKLCKAVREGKQTERKQHALVADIKIDFFLDRQTAPLLPSSVTVELPVVPDQKAPARHDAPPVPPPRWA